MKFNCLLKLTISIALVSQAGVFTSTADDMVAFEAESGALGSDFVISNSSNPSYITILTDGSAYNPGSAARVATYNVNFPSAGTYQLYARVRVGSGGYNDDSMFYANGFGNKSPTLDSDWVFVNGLAAVGYTTGSDVVDGAGTAVNQIWKWVNLSQFTGSSAFAVSAENLAQTFQIGARENGLDIDKFVFGTVGTKFTVSNLDSGTLPRFNINTNLFFGPEGVTIHRFSSIGAGFNLDGANPAAGLSFVNGTLYGTTLNGGTDGAGTIFLVNTNGTNFTAFHSFSDMSDAGNPQGGLIFSGNSFWGTSLAGGDNGAGAIFLANTNGSVSIVKDMSLVSSDNATNIGGASPSASLVLSDNTLYGTTAAGGSAGNGTVFSFSTNGSAFSVLHNFGELDSNTGTNADGALPCGGLVASANMLYGTAFSGGAGGSGVIFSIGDSNGSFSVLHQFTALDPIAATNADGSFPSGSLSVSHDMLYGCALAGGAGGKGVVFSVNTDGTGYKILHHFTAIDSAIGTNADGASPCAGVLISSNTLYGTTSAGGSGAAGTVFSINLNTGRFTILHSFGALLNNDTNADGAFPVAPLVQVGGALYGVAFLGGPGAAGTIFSIPVPSRPAFISNIIKNSNGATTIHFIGGAYSTNIVQFSSDLMAPVTWLNISTNVADAYGSWSLTDENSSATGFYRSYEQ